MGCLLLLLLAWFGCLAHSDDCGSEDAMMVNQMIAAVMRLIAVVVVDCYG